jgi:hypothetical protein
MINRYKWEHKLAVSQYDPTVNKKFLGVQNPFYKKGFARRRH